MMEHVLDFLRIRHAKPARLLRAGLSRMLAGKEAWPLVFRAPDLGEGAPLGISSNLYVHLPFCQTICPHCPYNRVLLRKKLANQYGLALEREIASYLEQPELLPVETLYFGGGTPSLTPELIEQVITMLTPHLQPETEIGVEVHPADVTPELLNRLHSAGVNRISLGIETLRSDLLKLLRRRYTPEEAVEAIHTARATGFNCVDVNLIHGIPGQEVENALEDTRLCIVLGVDQISSYPLFSFAHTPLGKYGKTRPPGERKCLRAQKALSGLCRNNGLERTSVWSFTRPGISPYSTVTHENYVGFGAGAGSKVDGNFWFNTFSVPEYVNSPVTQPALTMIASERLRRMHWLYWAIYRTRIDAVRYHALFGHNLEDDFGWMIRLLKVTGMVQKEALGWRLTESGAIWVHRLQSLFSLTYIDQMWLHCQDQPWPKKVVMR